MFELIADLSLLAGVLCLMIAVLALMARGRQAALGWVAFGLCLVVLPTVVLNRGSQDDPGPDAGAELETCPDLALVGLRGSGERRSAQQGYGSVVGDFREELVSSLDRRGMSMADVPVDYPALSIFSDEDWSLVKDVLFLLQTGDSEFLRSATSGADRVVSQVRLIETLCERRTKVVLSGYSQGALSIRLALASLDRGQRDLIASAVVFADPLRLKGQTVPSGYPVPRGRGIARPLVARGIVEVLDEPAASLDSWCIRGDGVCDSYELDWRQLGTYSTHTRGYRDPDLIRAAARRAAGAVG